jgi:hypothetical protein
VSWSVVAWVLDFLSPEALEILRAQDVIQYGGHQQVCTRIDYHARLLEILRQKSISLKAQGVDFSVPPYTAVRKSFRTSNSLAW